MNREDAEKTFNAIKDGGMDFDDFWHGWLDNLRNEIFAEGYHWGVREEREECAKVVEARTDTGDITGVERDAELWNLAVNSCVKAIRARGAT